MSEDLRDLCSKQNCGNPCAVVIRYGFIDGHAEAVAYACPEHALEVASDMVHLMEETLSQGVEYLERRVIQYAQKIRGEESDGVHRDDEPS